ncbi:MAG: A/G-specific adenine glycosylase [Legionellales bacterium]|nr:A/G-specific adenine glycosylase [Legionellales bacterium]|tara:strand:+ start:369 stop:1448 length:1080 start_codon:yes stop_codon:yes gene_type:complete
MDQNSTYDPLEPSQLQSQLLQWYHQSGRHDLPWQNPASPYRVWISEIMCQQTQVKTVIPYFERFMSKFPTLKALSEAHEDEVLAHWSGLGYYARARNLHRTAQILVNEFKGVLPHTVDDLITLPGIGRSTAGAIASLAFKQPAPILDGNVKRVLARLINLNGWPGHPQNLKTLWALSEQLVPQTNPHHFTQAMMDLGALLCTRQQPSCHTCPLSDQCLSYLNQTTHTCPAPRPKRTQPQKYSTWLLWVSSHHILLKQHQAKGLWGGLWLPPSLETGLTLYHTFDLTHTTSDQIKIETDPWIQHTFTHFKLTIIPIVIQCSNLISQVPEGYTWQPLTRLDCFAHPRPLTRWMQAFSLKNP